MIGEFAALGAALSWTVSALLYRRALQEIQPILANIVRLVLTSLVLLVFVVAIGKLGSISILPQSVLVLATVSGIIGLGLGDTLYLLTLKIVGVSRAVPITCTYPLFTLLFAFILASQPPTLTVSLGAIIIVVGIWLVSVEKGSNRTISRRLLLLGVTIGIITAVLWALSITMMNLAVTYNRQLDSALAINTFRVATTGVTLAAFTPFLYRSHRFAMPSRKTVISLMFGGLVALGLGWFFLSYSLTITEESRAVPISSVTPLFSTLIAVVMFREKTTVENALGSVMIVIGIFIIFLL